MQEEYEDFDDFMRSFGSTKILKDKSNKIEIDITSLIKTEKRVWVKPTAKRKGHYRKIKGAKKVEGITEKLKVSEMTPSNVEKIIALEDMGAKGGLHKEESSVIKFKDGSHAMYKTVDEDFATSQFYMFGEVSTYKVSNIVGWDVCPETVSGDFGKGEGSVQKWIEDGRHPGVTPDSIDWDLIEEKHLDDLSKIFVLDTVNGNSDRHQGNIVIKDDKLYMIDNEFIGDTKEGLNACKSLFNSTHGGYVGRNRLLENMERSSIPNFNRVFHEKVIGNMVEIMKKRFEIINYYTDSIPSLGNEQQTERERILRNIKDNFDYIEQYLKNPGEFE